MVKIECHESSRKQKCSERSADLPQQRHRTVLEWQAGRWMKTWQRKGRSLKVDKAKMSKESLTKSSRHSVSGGAAASRVSVDSPEADSSKKTHTQNGVSPLPLIHSGK